MRFRIHYTLSDGSEDSIVLEGNSIAEIRKQADEELARRNAIDPWSEEL